MNTPNPEATLSGTLALASDDEWDDATLASLHEDNAPPAAELVVSDYSQTDGQRRMVNWIRRAEDCEDYLLAHPHLGNAEAIRRAAIIVTHGADALDSHLAECEPRAIAASLARPMLPMDPEDRGTIYAALMTPAPAKPKPKRPRPSQARKTITGGK